MFKITHLILNIDTIYPCYRGKPIIIRRKGKPYREGSLRLVIVGSWKSVFENKRNTIKETNGSFNSATAQLRNTNKSIILRSPLNSQNSSVMTVKDNISFKVPNLASNLPSSRQSASTNFKKVSTEVDEVDEVLEKIRNTRKETNEKVSSTTAELRNTNKSIILCSSLNLQNSSVKAVRGDHVSTESPNSSSNVSSTQQPGGSTNSKKELTEVDEVLEKIRNTCPYCEKRFNSAKQVEGHVKYVHRKPYSCDKCKRSCYTEKALEEHKLIHQPDYFFECKICHVKYKSMDGLKRHYIRKHSDYESRYICEHCGRSYKLKIDLTHHVKRTHTSQLQICRFCGKAVKDVKGHEWRHQKRNGEIKYEYPCHLCRKKFHHRSRLDNHLMLHKKGFKCDQCGKEYPGTRELLSHKRFKHDQTNISTCILCQKTFPSISNFYQHVLTHAGIRPYKCDICEEDFTQRSSLLRHRRHHPGPLPSLQSPHPQIAELARSYLQKLQRDDIDKSFVLDARS